MLSELKLRREATWVKEIDWPEADWTAFKVSVTQKLLVLCKISYRSLRVIEWTYVEFLEQAAVIK